MTEAAAIGLYIPLATLWEPCHRRPTIPRAAATFGVAVLAVGDRAGLGRLARVPRQRQPDRPSAGACTNMLDTVEHAIGAAVRFCSATGSRRRAASSEARFASCSARWSWATRVPGYIERLALVVLATRADASLYQDRSRRTASRCSGFPARRGRDAHHAASVDRIARGDAARSMRQARHSVARHPEDAVDTRRRARRRGRPPLGHQGLATGTPMLAPLEFNTLATSAGTSGRDRGGPFTSVGAAPLRARRHRRGARAPARARRLGHPARGRDRPGEHRGDTARSRRCSSGSARRALEVHALLGGRPRERPGDGRTAAGAAGARRSPWAPSDAREAVDATPSSGTSASSSRTTRAASAGARNPRFDCVDPGTRHYPRA